MTKAKGDGPNPIDVYVGNRVRERRLELRMSQDVLAKHLELTFQQVQKYERGANRVSASKLYEMGRRLGVEVGWFFSGYDPMVDADAAANPPSVHALLSDPVGYELANSFFNLPTPSLRRKVMNFIRDLASEIAPVPGHA